MKTIKKIINYLKGLFLETENPYSIKRKKFKELAKLYEILKRHEEIKFTDNSDYMVINIEFISQLHHARQFIKKYLYADWRDKICMIWAVSESNAICSWESKEHPFIHIWLKAAIKDFPKELFPSEKCGFVKTTEESYNLICEN